jgi:hypothetical protein
MFFPLMAGYFVVDALSGGAMAPGQAANTASGSAPAPSPQQVAQGTVDVKRLLLLMDTDKNGKISKQEYMTFMAAEFDRLDVNHDGELDPKELLQSQFTSTAHGGTHR